MNSQPSKARTATAAILYAVGGLIALAGKVLRDDLDASGGVLSWVLGVLPNFLVASVFPSVVFLSRKSMSWRDFVCATGMIALGMCVYEVAQLWMPRRTFDWADLVATAVGAVVALGIGRCLFFARRHLHSPEPHSPDG